MVSTRSVRYKFSEGERVLCYEPDPTKAKVLYDSKVLEVIESKDKRGRRTVEYLIHFQGWNSSWDRCVSEDFVLKDTEENRQLQRDLAEKSQLQLGAYLYRRERKKGSTSSAGAAPAKRARQGFSDDGSSSSTQPDEGGTEGEGEAEDETGDTDSSSGSGEREPRDLPHSHLGRANLNLPLALRDRLTFDYHLVVKRGRLSRLPAAPNAAQILESFVKWFARAGAWHPPRGRNDPPQKPDLLDVSCRLNLVREVADGLRVYFDFILRGHLLYKQEMQQYHMLCGQFVTEQEKKVVKEEVEDDGNVSVDEGEYLGSDEGEGAEGGEGEAEGGEGEAEGGEGEAEGGEGEAEGGEGEAEGGVGEVEGGEGDEEGDEGEAEGGDGEAEGGDGEAEGEEEVGEGEAEGGEGEGGSGAAYSPRGEYEHLPPDPAPDTPPAHGPDPPEEKANVKIKVEIKQEPKDEVTEEGEGEEEVQEEVKEALKLDIKEEIKEEPVEKPQVEEPPEEIERRPATRSGNVARRLRSHKSALSQSESEEPPPPLPLPMPLPMPLPLALPLPSTSGCAAVDIKPFDTHPASVPAASSASSSSSAGEGWPRLLAPAPAAAPAPVTRTPLSLLLDKVAKWQIVPREGTEHLPCRVYGAIHLARLFVKLPEFLNETQISDFKLKLVLKHIDMFVQYLDEHSEWFGENYYLSDSLSRATK